MYREIVIGKTGLVHQRRFIVKYFKEGTRIVSIDDDVASVHEKVEKEKTLRQLKNVHAFFKSAFQRCENEGLYMWGIYPVLNDFYMRPGVSTDLKFIVGPMHGFINRHSRDIMPTLPEKNDVELSILYYLKDGGVVRFNNIAVKTKYFNPNGGLGDFNSRFQAHQKSAEALQARYQDLGYIWHRKSGMAEFRLRRKPRVQK
jgi:hypothetical protein